MRSLLKKLAWCCAPLIAFAVAAQVRHDEFAAAQVRMEVVTAWPLADGGCEARWCGRLPALDGGVTLRACTDTVDLRAPVNVNRCNALLGAGDGRRAARQQQRRDARGYAARQRCCDRRLLKGLRIDTGAPLP